MISLTDRGPPRRIAVVSVGRSDYGIYAPILDAIDHDAALKLILIVSGGTLSSDIEADGRRIDERVEVPDVSDDPVSCAVAMGMGTMGFAQAYARTRPDILLVLGDRFEMHSAVVAAVPMNLPIAHIHGGELTFGSMDDSLRHSITKLSHLHFAATEDYARRIIHMGEEPWRVFVTGAPSLDKLRNEPVPDAAALQRHLNISLPEPPLLVTFHPDTREDAAATDSLDELLGALATIKKPIVFTAPNADHGSVRVRATIRAFVEQNKNAHWVENFGRKWYFGMLAYAAVMVGNSSSGIIEAASFGLPVVNIGHRQQGRTRGGNVIDVAPDRRLIEQAIANSLGPEFRQSLTGLANPYGNGTASDKIVTALRETVLGRKLLVKRFYE